MQFSKSVTTPPLYRKHIATWVNSLVIFAPPKTPTPQAALGFPRRNHPLSALCRDEPPHRPCVWPHPRVVSTPTKRENA